MKKLQNFKDKSLLLVTDFSREQSDQLRDEKTNKIV
jgi:hypothetical protein